MSDEELRDLERRHQATGRPEDEVAWLSARLRAGRLPRERLELAALLGHEPARAALGLPEREAPLTCKELTAALGASASLSARARIAAGWLVLPVWERGREEVWSQHKLGLGEDWAAAADAGGFAGRHQATLEAAERWLLLGRPEDAAAARAAALAAEEVGSRFSAFLRTSIDAIYGHVRSAAYAIERAGQLQGARLTVDEVVVWGDALTRRLEKHVRPQVVRALAAELVPWLLVERDPVRDRMAQRGDRA